MLHPVLGRKWLFALTFSEILLFFVLSYLLSGITLPGCCIGTFLSSLGCCGLAVPAPQEISRFSGVSPCLRGVQRKDVLQGDAPACPWGTMGSWEYAQKFLKTTGKHGKDRLQGWRGGRKKGRLRGDVASVIFPDETRKKPNTAPIFSWKTPCSSALKAGFSSLAQLKRFLCCFKENVGTEQA